MCCRNSIRLSIIATIIVLAMTADVKAVPIKIMPLGDSITEGVPVIGGYRLPLQAKLNAAGISTDFVGSSVFMSDGMGDPEHEGHGGYTITGANGIQTLPVASRISTYQPDITLLMIGTNDVTLSNTTSNMISQLDTLISTIEGVTLSNGGRTKLIVAQITPRGAADKNAATVAYNALIPGVVANHQAQGQPVTLVNMYSALNAGTDLPDGIHPNAGGYQKMADVWFPGIQAVVPEPASALGLSIWFARLFTRRLRRK